MALVYGAVTLAILLVVAAVALIVSPPSPPAIAEYAPQATERIDEALKAQSSKFGEGDGGDCAADQDCVDVGGGGGGDDSNGSRTPTTRGVIDVSRVRRCIGDPPRQTEDPQSPPCINYWEGDNGGSTTKGVTGNEIRIAATGRQAETAELLLPHFNGRYEFYGRKLRMVTVPYYDTPKETVVAADEEADAFAVLSTYGNDTSLDHRELQREASRRGLVNASGMATYATADDYRSMAPYAWTYSPTFDEIQASLGRFVCTSLAGRNAEFAGGGFKLQKRKVALVTAKSPGPVDVSVLHDILRRCDLPISSTTEIAVVPQQTEVTTAHARWRDDGVTTLLILAASDEITQWMTKLPSDFEPEWVIGGMGTHENEAQWMVVTPPNYRRSLFGTFTINKLLPREDTPSWWAYGEGPGREPEPGRPPSELAAEFDFNMLYRSLLLLSSGIQLAGPELTPETFQAGLQKATFPNPDAGQAPFYQARVDFGPGDHAMTEGASVVWWSDAAPSYGGAGLSKQGGWCYVGRGRRFTVDWTDVSGSLFDPDPRNCR